MRDRETHSLSLRLRVFVGAWALLLCVNNLLPYGGLRDDSCQTMFSELEWFPDRNNHLLMPQVMLGDAWAALHDVTVEVGEEPAPTWLDEQLLDWLGQPDRELNRDAVRVVVDRLCDRGHRLGLTFRETARGPRRTVEDACADPLLRDVNDAVPVRRYETDYPADPRDIAARTRDPEGGARR